jgi:hypothetical protein
VKSRHQTGARWCTNGAAGIELRESHAFSGEAIDVWRVNLFLAVTAEIAITQIVGEDE